MTITEPSGRLAPVFRLCRLSRVVAPSRRSRANSSSRSPHLCVVDSRSRPARQDIHLAMPGSWQSSPVSDARALTTGVLGSLLASLLLILFSAVGVAWSLTVGFATLSVFLTVIVLRRRISEGIPQLGLVEAHNGPNDDVEHALDSASTSIDFWGVSANRTAKSVSAQQAMLRVADNGGAVRFLLMDPGGTMLARRASDEGDEVEAWSSEIQSTVARLKKFAAHHSIAIQIRYFDSYPVWRYVCLDNTLATINWFLPKKPGHHSPFILLKNTPDGLYWPIRRSFDEAWTSAREA